VPAGLSRTLGSVGSSLVITFAGDVPSAPGCTIVPLSTSGDSQLPNFGPAQGAQRRYRLTLSGLSLDFGATPFIGIALWAQGQERIAPHRVTPWPAQPQVVSAGDPRPPFVPVIPVTLGSLPDAAGQSHARVAWQSQPGAAGYFVYEATETALLEAFALPQPSPGTILQSRGDALRNAFKGNPVRRPFTRLNATLIPNTPDASGHVGTDVALPRGSKEIHAYIAVGVSAGQVESAWPSGTHADDSLYLIAAPHVDVPLAPMISLQRVLEGGVYKAKLQIETRLGPRPRQIDLHRVRVDDAAKELDTMGPPVARIKSSGSGWNVTPVADAVYGDYIGSVQGEDAPPGSWRRVWYRAVAWSGQDPARGGLPGRSPASNAAWTVVPPPTAPELSALSLVPGAPVGSFLLQWTSAAPLKKTPLGPHRIAVRATVPGAAPNTPALLALDGALGSVPTAQPPADSAVWITGTAAGVTTYRALVKRPSADTTVKFYVSITDPLGRAGEQLMMVDPIPPDAPPDLENLKAVRQLLVIPHRVILTFTSSSPIAPQPDGVYTLRVVGELPPHAPGPSIELALGKVPTKAPVLLPLPVIYAIRTGTGPVYTYAVVTTANVIGFAVRLTAPDGTHIDKTVSVT
jgi:hypothetical protein